MAVNDVTTGGQLGETHQLAPDPEEVDIPPSLDPLKDTTVNGPASSERATRTARDIRKQIDYYFSAENLEHDFFILKKMNGSKNRPIPVQTIADFSKMQKFKPLKQIIEALKTSKTVNIIDKAGETCLQRKEPYHRTKQASAAGPQKSKSTAVTGFEDYFADAPLTPQAAREEADLYDTDRPIVDRIESAVQRYQTRRKMHSFTKNVFTKWLMYGGVDISPAAFRGGLMPEELEGMTAKEKKAAVANVHVFASELDERGDPKWDVDFIGVARSFLSRILPDVFDLDTEDRLKGSTNILQNFYRYLLYHNVCPEHKEEINTARSICQTAEWELMATFRLQTSLPGPFNTACSTLFGGFYHGMYAGDQGWMQDLSNMKLKIGQSDVDAKRMFMTGMVAMDLEQEEPTSQQIVKAESSIGLEVVCVNEPTSDAFDFYAALGAVYSPLGTLTLKRWTPPDFADWDLPHGATPEASSSTSYTMLLEQDLLEVCFPGMKLEATVRTLSSGIQFFDEITAVRCSFYTVMENELVKGWKDPRWWTREELIEREASLLRRGKAAEVDEDNGGADDID